MSVGSTLLAGLGIALFLEGLPYFVSPPLMRRYLATMTTVGDGTLRAAGLLSMAGGLFVAWLATR